MLTKQQIKNALKLNNEQKDSDIDSLALQLQIPIDNIALRILDLPSPTGRRQIVDTSPREIYDVIQLEDSPSSSFSGKVNKFESLAK